eukprot:TRINITY_DN2186_c0_g6_i1.p3 TRINITY_DN2186_c0_g6~~TRINITY_DN2186_c0_g6_i1.p3  ORF type:complete len:259 (+),score=109.53 TRINITY_DN2186_c0_g6_i1:61-837(+)
MAAAPGRTIALRYTVVDGAGASVRDGRVTQVQLGAGQLDPEWEPLLLSAQPGETVRLPSTAAEMVRVPKAGSAAAYYHQAEVLAAPGDAAPPLGESDVPVEEWLEDVASQKEDASFYIKTDPAAAVEGYVHCIAVLDRLKEHHAAAKEGPGAGAVAALLLSCLLNAALASLSLKAYPDALGYTARCLALAPHHEKALYRRGAALRGMGEYAAAEAVLRDVVERYPENKTAARELREVEALRVRDAQREKAVYSRMFAS